jgi:hypothetical protein
MELVSVKGHHSLLLLVSSKHKKSSVKHLKDGQINCYRWVSCVLRST